MIVGALAATIGRAAVEMDRKLGDGLCQNLHGAINGRAAQRRLGRDGDAGSGGTGAAQHDGRPRVLQTPRCRPAFGGGEQRLDRAHQGAFARHVWQRYRFARDRGKRNEDVQCIEIRAKIRETAGLRREPNQEWPRGVGSRLSALQIPNAGCLESTASNEVRGLPKENFNPSILDFSSLGRNLKKPCAAGCNAHAFERNT